MEGASRSPTLNTSQISVAQAPQPYRVNISNAHRNFLLGLFCVAQFLDTFNQGAIYSAIPSIKEALNMTESEPAWLVSAFGLTFASFLLVGGRMSDVYNPKGVFMFGLVGLGLVSLGAGFLNITIPLLVLRAIAGILGALTIPSSLALLVVIYPEPSDQSFALAIFGGIGAIGNILGLVIGAAFAQFASWRWVFWFITCVAIPLAVVCWISIPAIPGADRGNSAKERFQKLDMVGVFLITVALVLFIFALTSASDHGWGTAYILCPLIISIFVLAGAFYWEASVPFEHAAVPPRTWFYPNFAVLFALALTPYFWWNTNFTVLNIYWQQIFHWTPISCAVHTIPTGTVAILISFTENYTRKLETKWILLGAQVAMAVATVLLTFADHANKYWSYVFPAYVIGSAGCMLTFMHVNIAIFRNTPPRMSGVVGALFNSGLQVGTAVGIAAFTCIETALEGPEGFAEFDGRRAGYWFMFAIIICEIIALIIFYRTGLEGYKEENEPTSSSASTIQVSPQEKTAAAKSAAEAGELSVPV